MNQHTELSSVVTVFPVRSKDVIEKLTASVIPWAAYIPIAPETPNVDIVTNILLAVFTAVVAISIVPVIPSNVAKPDVAFEPVGITKVLPIAKLMSPPINISLSTPKPPSRVNAPVDTDVDCVVSVNVNGALASNVLSTHEVPLENFIVFVVLSYLNWPSFDDAVGNEPVAVNFNARLFHGLAVVPISQLAEA